MAETGAGVGEGFRMGEFDYVPGISPLGSAVGRVSRAALKKKNAAYVRLALDWDEFVGPSMGEKTKVKNFSHAGTLTILCANSTIAMELSYLRLQLMKLINTKLGGEFVTKISFVQGPIPRKEPILKREEVKPKPAAVPQQTKDLIASVGHPELEELLLGCAAILAAREQKPK